MQKLGKLFETHDPRLVLIFRIQGNWKSKMSDKSCIKLPGVFNSTIFLWNQVDSINNTYAVYQMLSWIC